MYDIFKLVYVKKINKIIQKINKYNINVNTRNENNIFLLDYAILYNDENLFKELLN